MSTTIVFVVLHNGEVVNVCEYEELAKATAARYEGATIDPWILDARNVLQATLDEWLLGRKVYPVDDIDSIQGETVYFEDECVRGIGKFMGLCPSSSKINFIVFKLKKTICLTKLRARLFLAAALQYLWQNQTSKGLSNENFNRTRCFERCCSRARR